MLRRLALGCFDGRILFRCRPSITGLRSIHHVSNGAGAHRWEPADSQPAAAKDPAGWVMLNSYGAIRTADSSVADPKTVADSRTSTGRHLRVSLGRAQPPPASTFVYYDFPGSAAGEDDDQWFLNVFAAHDDSLILEMSHRDSRSGFEDNRFLYRAGGAARAPSLVLLPEVTVHMIGGMGLLRRGDSDILLAQLYLKYDDRCSQRIMAGFYGLGFGTRQWELQEPVPIVQDYSAKPYELFYCWYGTNTVVPVGDRFLCWVNYESGFFLCDMADEARPKVRHVLMPADARRCRDHYEDDDDTAMKFSRDMGAAGASAVRFVAIDPHCCCCKPWKSTCGRSRFAFTVNTWTMNLSTDEPLAWVKDSEIDCEELWALPGYEGLPRANLECPIVSLDNPNVVCFLVSNFNAEKYTRITRVWMIELNIKTKTLVSVVQFTNDTWRAYYHLPAKFQ